MRGSNAVAIVIGLAPRPAAAQVIGGESTYEDNYLHTPPSEPGTKPVDAKPKDVPPRVERQPEPPSDNEAPPY